MKKMAVAQAKNIETPEDLGKLTGFMNKLVIEAALNAEMTEHLGHEKHQKRWGSNPRSGYSKKIIIGDDGQLELTIPRQEKANLNRNWSNSIKHGLIKLIIFFSFYTPRVWLQGKLLISSPPTWISRVTDSVKERVIEWQNRPLDKRYPIV